MDRAEQLKLLETNPRIVITSMCYESEIRVYICDKIINKKCVTIPSPIDEIIKEAIKQDWIDIKHINQPTEEYQMIAIRQSRFAIIQITYPTEKAKQLHNMLREI
jgi:hypothetical protein